MHTLKMMRDFNNKSTTMEYNFGKPISTLLAEYLKRHTTEKDCQTVSDRYNNERSKSTINQIRIGRNPLSEENAKYVDDLFKIAVTNDYEERKRFKPLLQKIPALT